MRGEITLTFSRLSVDCILRARMCDGKTLFLVSFNMGKELVHSNILSEKKIELNFCFLQRCTMMQLQIRNLECPQDVSHPRCEFFKLCFSFRVNKSRFNGE